MKTEKHLPPTPKQLRKIATLCLQRDVPLPPTPETQHAATQLINAMLQPPKTHA